MYGSSRVPTAHQAADAIAARLKEMICKAAAWSVSHPTSMLPTRRHTIQAEEPLTTTH